MWEFISNEWIARRIAGSMSLLFKIFERNYQVAYQKNFTNLFNQ